MSKFPEAAWDTALSIHRRRMADLQGVPTNAIDYKLFDQTLKDLRREYDSGIVSRCINKLSSVFQQLDTFQMAFTTLAQIRDESAMVWGVLQVLISCACRYLKTLEDFTQLLSDLTSTVTRINRYLELLPTNNILKELTLSIYGDYVECCVMAVRFYKKSGLRNFLGFLFKDVGKKFNTVKTRIAGQIDTFEKECRADIDELVVRQLTLQQPPPPPVRTEIFSVPYSMNDYFLGREDVLNEIHAILSPNTKSSVSCQTSCLIHAMGGMGKTQCALTYAYRHRDTYPYVFWLGAQKEPDLGVTFAAIANLLELPNIKGLGQGRRMNLVRAWLEETTEKFLLIFDNAESFESIRPYWPSSKTGSILVTSQMAAFSQVIRNNIALSPLPQDAATALLLELLQLKSPTENDRKAVARIVELVGGLPIAVAHIAGSMFSTQLTAQEAVKLFEKQHLQPIWSTENSWSTHAYTQRLNMVWDVALRELTAEAFHVLEILSLMNPDAIHESILMGFRDLGIFSVDFEEIYPEIRSNLSKRQLVQRNVGSSDPYLSLHRSLQINVRDTLSKDWKKYEIIFREAVLLVRRVFPITNKSMACQNEDWGIYEKYQPQVQTLQKIAQTSRHNIAKIPEFAHLLGDAGNYYWERGLLDMGIQSCSYSVEIWEQIANADLMIMSTPLTLWGLMALEVGTKSRKEGMDCFIRCLDLRAEYLEKAEDGGEKDDRLLYCNAWSDYCISLLEFGHYDAAEKYLRLTLALKSREVTEVSYPQMFGITYGHVATVFASKKMYREAKAFSARGIKMTRLQYGGDQRAAMAKFLFFQANIWLEAGDLEEALEAHLHILKERLEIFGTFGTHTRYSYYAVGLTYVRRGDLRTAESMLRKSLDSLQLEPWLDDAIARSRFLLARVISEVHTSPEKQEESITLKKLAEAHRKQVMPDPAAIFVEPVEDELLHYEYLVPMQCGRTMMGHSKIKAPNPADLVPIPAHLVHLSEEKLDQYGLDGNKYLPSSRWEPPM